MTITIISHPDCMLHDAGSTHPESKMRIQVINEALKRYPFKEPIHFIEALCATKEQLMRAHDETYIDWIHSISPKHDSIGIDADTLMNPHTYRAALLAAGAVVLAVDCVMQEKSQVVFCNVRPPGHHAEKDKAMGFCFFNNVAVGVMHAIAEYKLHRIAIIDFDVHHGNGTQNIFQHDKRVLYCSSFEHPLYPGYDEENDNEHIIGVPLKAGTEGKEFREKVKAAWFDKILAFKPELVFFSAGFDAHIKDPLADLKLLEDDYVWLTKEIKKLSKQSAAGKMISVLEGGYHLEALAHSVPLHVAAMSFTFDEV